MNGLEFVAKEEDAAQAILSLAAGTPDEADFKNWLSDNIRGSKLSAILKKHG